MLLHELIDVLWSAKISGNEEEIRQAYEGLAAIGIYKESADIILKEWHPGEDIATIDIPKESPFTFTYEEEIDAESKNEKID